MAWLARVGFEMQLRRMQQADKAQESPEILVTESEVSEWILSAISGPWTCLPFRST